MSSPEPDDYINHCPPVNPDYWIEQRRYLVAEITDRLIHDWHTQSSTKPSASQTLDPPLFGLKSTPLKADTNHPTLLEAPEHDTLLIIDDYNLSRVKGPRLNFELARKLSQDYLDSLEQQFKKPALTIASTTSCFNYTKPIVSRESMAADSARSIKFIMREQIEDVAKSYLQNKENQGRLKRPLNVIVMLSWSTKSKMFIGDNTEETILNKLVTRTVPSHRAFEKIMFHFIIFGDFRGVSEKQFVDDSIPTSIKTTRLSPDDKYAYTYECLESHPELVKEFIRPAWLYQDAEKVAQGGTEQTKSKESRGGTDERETGEMDRGGEDRSPGLTKPLERS